MAYRGANIVELDNIKKHSERLVKQIDFFIGKGRGKEILTDLCDVTGEETPQECAKWANDVSKRLEDNINPEKLILIRQECACVKTNKYSAYNKKYFKELREDNADEMDYLKDVTDFLNGRPRIGKKVEFIDGKIITHMGAGKTCGCFVTKNGWDKPASTTWCRCCQGTLYSIYQFVLPDKICHMDIIKTHATGGSDCVFSTWYAEK
jgi:hypothetical protein